MTYPPPVAANGDYSSHLRQDATYLLPTAAGGAGPDPDAAGEIQGGRRAGRRSPFGRLRRRPPHDGPEAVPGQLAAVGVVAAASPDPEYTDGPAGPVTRVAGYRPLHRAGRAEHPGISWSAARPGPAQVSSEEVNVRLGPAGPPRNICPPAGPTPAARARLHCATRPNDLAGDLPAAAWVAGRSGDPGRSPAGAPSPAGVLAAAAAPPAAAVCAPGAVPAPPEPAAASDPLYRVLAGLAMRDLTLVESLLQVAEQLESEEENPGQLELLFRIDHLATRMRRNSQNLLVLAGQGGQDRGTEPVPLLDVVRAAISEITEYSRAQISALPDVKLIGPSADDVSHILAELLDNATSKSPESAAVIVRAERTGDGTMIFAVPPPAPAPDGPSAALAASRPPLTPTFAPADPDGLPRRRQGHAAAGEPDEARASQIRADLSGFRLGQQAAWAATLPEVHHRGGTPPVDPGRDGELAPAIAAAEAGGGTAAAGGHGDRRSANAGSIAEISAGLGIPLGVVRVLVSDLADAGSVRIHPTAAGAGLSDTVLLERVLRGLQTIRR